MLNTFEEFVAIVTQSEKQRKSTKVIEQDREYAARLSETLKHKGFSTEERKIINGHRIKALGLTLIQGGKS